MLGGFYVCDADMGYACEVAAWVVMVLLLDQGMPTASDAGDVESARCRVRCLAHLKHVSSNQSCY